MCLFDDVVARTLSIALVNSLVGSGLRMGASFEAGHTFTESGTGESQIIKGNGGYNMGFPESLNSLGIIASFLP